VDGNGHKHTIDDDDDDDDDNNSNLRAFLGYKLDNMAALFTGPTHCNSITFRMMFCDVQKRKLINKYSSYRKLIYVKGGGTSLKTLVPTYQISRC
jgi:hypothetical protein